MKALTVSLCIAGALVCVRPVSSLAQLPPVRERLGFRSGYIQTLGELNDAFGGGGHLTLHFTERAYNHLYVDFQVGAVYLGDSKHPEIAQAIFNNDNVLSEMRVLYFSVGPSYTFDLGEYWTGYASGGAGVYSVSILFDSGIQAYDTSDQHFGFNFGGGVLWRFTDTWNIDLNFTVHHFTTKQQNDDLFYIYTGKGATSPYLLQFATGVCIDLH